MKPWQDRRTLSAARFARQRLAVLLWLSGGPDTMKDDIHV
jgi:hypothetical protein